MSLRCDSDQCSSSHLCHGWVLAEVEVTTEIAVVADDLRQDVGVTGVTELSIIGKLSDVHETQEVSFQLVHLVHYVGIQRKDLNRQKTLRSWQCKTP